MDLLFHNPQLLWLLLLLPLIAYLKGRTGKNAALIFSSTAIARKVSGASRNRAGRLLFVLRLLALASLIVALARPQLGEQFTETEASGIDIMLVVDVSGSMHALDFATRRDIVNRLDVVKRTIVDFIKQRPNDRIGLIAFSRESYLVSPLTLNHDWLMQNVERLEIGMVDSTATAIGPAIAMSANSMRDLPADSRVVVLLTDGEDNVNQIPPITAAEAAKAFGIKIYTIAAGSPGRVPMPAMDRSGNVMRDRNGDIIVAGYMDESIDTETLREIASITGGQFYHATNTREMEQIYREIDQLEKTEVSIQHYATFHELFFWPALTGLLLLALEQALAQTKLRKLP